MKKSIPLFLLCGLSVHTLYGQQPLEPALHQLIQTYIPMAHVGFVVMDAESGKILSEYQSQKSFAPASTLKLLTGYAALKALGPQFQYSTQLFQTGPDWTLRFSGDPSFSANHLAQMLAEAKKQGGTQITGNLLIDDTLFSDEPYGSGWMFDDLQWGFAAPAETLSLDENTFSVVLTPGVSLGEPTQLEVEHPEYFPNLKITSNVKTVTAEKADQLCHLSIQNKGLDFHFSGCWPIGVGPISQKIAIRDPKARLNALLPHLLKKAQITFKGKILYQKMDSNNQKLLAEHRSAPLNVMLAPLLSDSNNQYANSFTKSIGYQALGEGTFQAGVLAMKTFLKITGIDLQQLQLADGTGLSYYNLLSPQSLNRLLLHIYNDKTTRDIFLDNLAVSGEKGSLKVRLQAHTLAGRIKAKTGSVTGIAALAGFAKTQNNSDIIFTVIVNGALVERERLNQFLAEFCHVLVTHPETNAHFLQSAKVRL